jgi:two-component system chemotaxis sensor kinase CheA
MSLDLSQFRDAFFEECTENLDAMENGLLGLELKADNAETINTIFRGAHSIKGGSATFGFMDVAEFTHVLEALLDRMRDGHKIPMPDDVSLLLESVDWVRGMLSATQNNAAVDADRTRELKGRLEAALSGAAKAAPLPRQPPQIVPTPTVASTPAGSGTDIDEDEFEALLDDLYGKGSAPGAAPAVSAHGDQITDVEFEQLLDQLQGPGGQVGASASTAEVAQPQAGFEAPAKKDAPVPKPAEAVAQGQDQAAARTAGGGEGTSIRVAIDKVDALVNMVGELVITQSMLSELGANFDLSRADRLVDGLAQLERNTRELQESVMRIRMLPISFAFNRFPRLVRDLSQRLDKKVNLKVSGEQTELDKTVMEKIGDPLVHLVRNCIDHGIELPEQRRAAGKPETGTIHLNAYHKGGSIMIEIRDDGAGVNRKKVLEKARARGIVGEAEVLSDEAVTDLIFQPGFSTVDVVSDISGRGVGMDVVRRNIKDLGGNVEIRSEQGQGTLFTIRLPLTLAILDGQLVRVGAETYIIPLVSIVESLQIKAASLNSVAGAAELYKLRESYIPIVRLYELFNCRADNTVLAGGLLVVVEGDGQRAGLLVDELLGQQQVVIKSLETNFRRVDGVSGATILGDGTVAAILDISGLVQLSKTRPRTMKVIDNPGASVKAA